MQPILIHCGEFVTERLIEIFDNLGSASHVTYSCCRTNSYSGSYAKASLTLKLHRQHGHRPFRKRPRRAACTPPGSGSVVRQELSYIQYCRTSFAPKRRRRR